MFSKQKGPQWELVVPWKRVLHGFVVIMDCMSHPSAKKQTASLLCLDMFGPSVLLCSAAIYCFWWRQSFPRNPLQFFAILCWLRNTQDMLANCSKPYPERSQCTLLQEAVFTPMAGCGAYHQEVSPFLWVAKPLSGRDCREDTFQGVWGQPTWLHRWMTVRRWAMCLLGAFCSGRDASGMRAVDGTSDAYLGGEAIHNW